MCYTSLTSGIIIISQKLLKNIKTCRNVRISGLNTSTQKINKKKTRKFEIKSGITSLLISDPPDFFFSSWNNCFSPNHTKKLDMFEIWTVPIVIKKEIVMWGIWKPGNSDKFELRNFLSPNKIMKICIWLISLALVLERERGGGRERIEVSTSNKYKEHTAVPFPPVLCSALYQNKVVSAHDRDWTEIHLK